MTRRRRKECYVYSAVAYDQFLQKGASTRGTDQARKTMPFIVLDPFLVDVKKIPVVLDSNFTSLPIVSNKDQVMLRIISWMRGQQLRPLAGTRQVGARVMWAHACEMKRGTYLNVIRPFCTGVHVDVKLAQGLDSLQMTFMARNKKRRRASFHWNA